MPSLLTERNTTTVERKVMTLAVRELHRGSVKHRHLSAAFEHGQWWVLCRDCGASWSVVDVEGRDNPEGLGLERIDEGDESCY
jgi:hypothetical protein